MFRVVGLAALSVATPTFAQVTIAENGIQIAAPSESFSLYNSGAFFQGAAVGA